MQSAANSEEALKSVTELLLFGTSYTQTTVDKEGNMILKHIPIKDVMIEEDNNGEASSSL